MKRGDKHDHGIHGELTEQDGRILCHICGRWYKSLGAHSSLAHGVSAYQYREEYGLARGTPLAASDLRKTQSAHSKARIGTPEWERFTARRDPTAASHARDRDSFSPRAAIKEVRARQSRENIKGVTKPRTRKCAVCGDYAARGRGMTCSELCARIYQYEKVGTRHAVEWQALRDAGVSYSEIGRRFGTSHANVRSGLATYARHQENLAQLRELKPHLGRWAD